VLDEGLGRAVGIYVLGVEDDGPDVVRSQRGCAGEHVFSPTGTRAGDHAPGSAVAMFNDGSSNANVATAQTRRQSAGRFGKA